MKILSMKTTIFLGAMLSLLVCLMFTGCSNSETNSTSRGLTDFAHIEEEYLATIDSLNWPDGITLPDKLEDEDTGASFQVGSLSNDYNLVVLYQQHGKEFLICSLGSQSDSSRYDDVNYILKTIDESDYLTK